jgi:hypothetical protein
MSQFWSFWGRVMAGLALLFAPWCLPCQGAEYTVRSEHPRIWLTPSLLTRLRSQAAAGSPRWLALKQLCDGWLSYPKPYGDWELNYSLAYLISGDVRYADRAIALAQAKIDMGMAALNQAGTHGYDVRYVLPDVAITYDWCYDRLTPAQRAAFRVQLEAWSDWVWPETNPSRATGWSVHNPGDNFYHGFMMTWVVGLALYGDSPKAQGYIDVARTHWLTEARPYLEKYGAGGYFLEGTSYGTETLFRIFWYLQAHATATGEDLFDTPRFRWPREAILNQLYVTCPTLERMYPGGDQTRDAGAPLSDYGRSSALVSLWALDPTTAGYAKWWLDHITPNGNDFRWFAWEECLWYRDELPAVDYTAALPTGYLAAGSGWMSSRGSWAKDATYVVMMCGPTREAHQDAAQNEFMLYRGEWLVASARLKGLGGIQQEAAENNTITIGGQGQPGADSRLPKEKPRVLQFADTGRYAYFVGEAADAYSTWKWPNVVPVLREFRRELLFLKPNVVVVFDRVNAVDGTQVKRWHLNTLNEPTVANDSFRAVAGSWALFGKRLLPPGSAVEKVPLFFGRNGAQSSWRIDVVAPPGKNLDLFLNVLEAAPAAQTEPTPVQPLSTRQSEVVGAQIGRQVVVINLGRPAGEPIAYETLGDDADEHFVLDLDPEKWYLVTVRNAAGETLHKRLLLTTRQGVLTFSVGVAGAHQVTVRPIERGRGVRPAEAPRPDPTLRHVPEKRPIERSSVAPVPSPSGARRAGGMATGATLASPVRAPSVASRSH